MLSAATCRQRAWSVVKSWLSLSLSLFTCGESHGDDDDDNDALKGVKV